MPKFAANLTLLFTEHAFVDRVDHAAKARFQDDTHHAQPMKGELPA